MRNRFSASPCLATCSPLEIIGFSDIKAYYESGLESNTKYQFSTCNFSYWSQVLKAKGWLVVVAIVYFLVLPIFAPSVANQLPIISSPSYPITPQVLSNQYSSETPAQTVPVYPLPSANPNQGTLALGFTDPPSGGHYQSVTQLLVTITGVSIHSNLNNSWVTVGLNKTTVDLVGATQLEQLVSTLNVPNGHYDIIRFTVVSAIATVNSASLNPNNPQLNVVGQCPGQSQNPNCSSVITQSQIICPQSNAQGGGTPPPCVTMTSTYTLGSGTATALQATVTANTVTSTKSIQLSIPNGQIQLTITNGGITVTSGSVTHLIVDVRINENPITQAGVFAPTAWTAKAV